MNYELVMNTSKACTNPIRVKGYSWLFLTIREIFSIQLGIKSHDHCLGSTSKIKVHRRAAVQVVLALHFECIPAADSTKKTAL